MTNTNEAPQYFLDFEKKIDKKFNSIDQRFDVIDNKFNLIDQRFDIINKKFEGVNKRLDTHFEAIGELMVKVTGIETLLDRNRKDTLNLRSRTGRLEKKVFGEVQQS
jgi:archaellum component FlaC